MSLPAQKMREIIFQILFSVDSGAENIEEHVALFSKELEMSKKYLYQAADKVKQILDKKDILDEAIAKASTTYDLDRIQLVEKNILRASAFELLFEPNVSYKTAITEGMRLARKFSTAEAASYINAVLDAIYHAKVGQSVDPNLLTQSVSSLVASEEIASEAAQQQELTKDDEFDLSNNLNSEN